MQFAPRGFGRMGRFRKARVLASAGVLLAGVWGASMALFTSQASSSGSFTTGTVKIGATPAAVGFNAANMAPGDTVYGSVTVANDGTLDLRYAMTTSFGTTPTLATQLDVGVVTIPDATTCDTTSFASGTSVLASPTMKLSSLAFGDPAPGSQTGDRTLAPSAHENLCFKVLLPLGTPDVYQAATDTATFTFDAEQTANN